MDGLGALEGILMLLLGVYLFLGISILCDEHLCPALDKLCDHLRLPTALAAATFVSFGSSAPELIISTLGAARNKTELSVPAVLISALIAFAAIPPMVVKAAGPMNLHVREVARDGFAYLLTLLLFVYLNGQDEITSAGASLLLAAYFIYLVVVYLTSSSDEDEDNDALCACLWRRICCQRESGEAVGGSRNEPLLDPLKDNADGSQTEEADDAPGPVMACLQKPFEVCFENTIGSGAITGFVASMVWLGVLSYLAMLCAEEVVSAWCVNLSTAGVTLLAWGGQLPDTLAAIALAKSGKPDEAISQAIASQVINVSLGLGGPFLAYSLITGKATAPPRGEKTIVETVAVLVAVSVLAYFATMLPKPSQLREWMRRSGRWSATITNGRAAFLAVCFVVVYLASIATTLHGKPGDGL